MAWYANDTTEEGMATKYDRPRMTLDAGLADRYDPEAWFRGDADAYRVCLQIERSLRGTDDDWIYDVVSIDGGYRIGCWDENYDFVGFI